MDNSKQLPTLGTHGTGRRQRKENTQHRILKWWATPNPGNTRGWPQVLAMSKQLVPIIRHSQCYSWCQNVFDTIMHIQTEMTLRNS
jgi:hypothetical protein